MTVTLLGEVERVTFENKDTGFRVVRLHQVDGLGQQRKVTVVGTLPSVGPGTRVRVSGRLETDAKHGERFRAESLVVVVPETLEGLEKYLGSGVISGLGPGFAKRIVKYFGLDTLRTLDVEPHRLGEVPGLGKSKVEEVRKAWSAQRVLSNVLLALQGHGATPALAQKIVRHFGERAHEVVQQRPYLLAIEIPGIGFQTADKIARARGIADDDMERVQAGLLHELRSVADAGHCYAPRDILLERAAALLGIGIAPVASAIAALAEKNWLILEDERVFLEKLHAAEVLVAEHIERLLKAPGSPLPGLETVLKQFERENEIVLAPAQRQAVFAAAQEKFVVVTGGPGVGKTTIVRAILAIVGGQRVRVQLAAPTGRAAKRLSESTNHRATTLHRLLEVEGRTGKFQRNAVTPLEADLLIIDEASMIDLQLMAHLLEATPSAARVVFVGDADQLPSVGPGSVLRDLIASERVPVVRLEVIFRQGEQSQIISNSHRILAGEPPAGSNQPNGDFFLVTCKEPGRVRELVRELVVQRIPRKFGLEPLRDVQVLTPMHRGEGGTMLLNQDLQAALNPGGLSLEVGESSFRPGDKVMQRKNDYDKAVFNGDMGEVVSVDPGAGRVVVGYEGEDGVRPVVYERADLAQLGLAYAISIHKSQGSEYPAVVIVLLNQHFVLLSRHLLYTAVTRARKLCVVVAQPEALRTALLETRKEERATHLAARLRSTTVS